MKTVPLTDNELVLYITPPFPLLLLAVKLEETISATPLLYTAELLLTILFENSTVSMYKFLSFQTRALLTELSENVVFNMFNEPVLCIISPVSKLSNEQFLIIKLPLFSMLA